MFILSIGERHVEEDGGQLVEGDRIRAVCAWDGATRTSARGRGVEVGLPWGAF